VRVLLKQAGQRSSRRSTPGRRARASIRRAPRRRPVAPGGDLALLRRTGSGPGRAQSA
jgi:hypothetical protein